MRRPLAVANWKMNGTREFATTFVSSLVDSVPDGIDVLVCPGMPLLDCVKRALEGSLVALGAQDCSEYTSGAYTGETSAAMIREIGAEFVLIGHSERRRFYGDSDKRVCDKLKKAMDEGLCPIFCVGESIEERNSGAAKSVLERQLSCLQELSSLAQPFVLAYEPVWAIGTGSSATPALAQQSHEMIRAFVRGISSVAADNVRILYGGSVKAENVREMLLMSDIDGVLVGGASLELESFLAICKAADSTAVLG
jgi:triosephosphate isomerase